MKRLKNAGLASKATANMTSKRDRETRHRNMRKRVQRNATAKQERNVEDTPTKTETEKHERNVRDTPTKTETEERDSEETYINRYSLVGELR